MSSKELQIVSLENITKPNIQRRSHHPLSLSCSNHIYSFSNLCLELNVKSVVHDIIDLKEYKFDEFINKLYATKYRYKSFKGLVMTKKKKKCIFEKNVKTFYVNYEDKVYCNFCYHLILNFEKSSYNKHPEHVKNYGL